MATYTATLTPHIFSYPTITLRNLSLVSVRSLRYTFEQAFYACEIMNNATGEIIYAFTRSEEMYPSHITIAEAIEQITEHLDYVEGRTAEDEDEDEMDEDEDEVDTYWDDDDDDGHLWDVDAYCDDDE